ncbi:nucleotidyltransferase substrate binding protein [Granulicella sibirica]|uniref:Nucleotidyltransferase n=1 Tax=Granulicella sibirica TaxID=2479048 RepID=A0A4Q0T179_9BACT|nr:nucleotidyltransferase substrate binding protein [Granulicella sibirica]RXH55629.1 nucleotidyltransferase [Granulicella sibirica]
MNEVSYKPLGQAIERLRRSLLLFTEHRDDELMISMRDSVLLSFQFTYGLCRTMMERFLVEDAVDAQEVQEMSLGMIVPTANERGVLRADWAMWSEFRDARNQLAHVYSEPVAEMIMGKVPRFLEEASYR